MYKIIHINLVLRFLLVFLYLIECLCALFIFIRINYIYVICKSANWNKIPVIKIIKYICLVFKILKEYTQTRNAKT